MLTLTLLLIFYIEELIVPLHNKLNFIHFIKLSTIFVDIKIKLVYFKSINSNELDNILKYVNVDVMNYIVEDKKYYARDINELVKTFIKDKSIEDKIYYELNGIKIDGITITCEVNELMKLENLTKVY